MIIKNTSLGVVILGDLVLPNGLIGASLNPQESIIFFNEDARRSKALVRAYKQKVIEKISDEEPVSWKDYDIEIGINGRIAEASDTVKLNNRFVGLIHKFFKDILNEISGYPRRWVSLMVGVTNHRKVVNFLEDDVTITLTPNLPPEEQVRIYFDPSNVVKVNGGIFRLRMMDDRAEHANFEVIVTNDKQLENVNFIYRSLTR